MNIFMSRYEALELDHVALAATVAEDALRYPSAVLTGRAYGVGPVLARLYGVYTGPRTPAQKKSLLQGGGLGLFFLVIYSAYALAFWYGGSHLIADGEIESGTVMTCIFSVLMGAFGLAMLAPNLQAITFALTAAGKVLAVTKRVRPKIDATMPRGRTLDPGDCMGHIEIDHVDFTYPAALDRPALKNATVTFPAGTRSVLVGPDGSGKSTLTQLISRFYDPDMGCVRLDNMDLRDVNVRWLRQRIGVVQPHAILFPGETIATNIAFGLDANVKEHLSSAELRKKVERAARQANAHEFIQALPSGYDTVVAAPAGTPGLLPPPVPGSVHLTSSERQRVAIARAIVHDPTVIIMDEATKALDAPLSNERSGSPSSSPASSSPASPSHGSAVTAGTSATDGLKLVQHTLESISKNRTAISIVHRLRLAEAGGGGTLERAGNIIVMARGTVVESGTHSELMTLGGEYKRLVEAQRIRDEVRAWQSEPHKSQVGPHHSLQETESPGRSEDENGMSSQADQELPSTYDETPNLKAVDMLHQPQPALTNSSSAQPHHLHQIFNSNGDNARSERSEKTPYPEQSPQSPQAAQVEILAARPIVAPALRRLPFWTRVSIRLRRFPFLHRPRHESALYLLFRLAMTNKDKLIPLFFPGLFAAACSGCAYPVYSVLFGRSLHNFSSCTPLQLKDIDGSQMYPPGEDRLRRSCPEPNRGDMRLEAELNALYFFIVAILAGLAILVQTHNLMLNAAITIERIRAQCLSKLLDADISYFDDPSDAPSSFPDASGRDVRAATRVPSFFQDAPGSSAGGALSYPGGFTSSGSRAEGVILLHPTLSSGGSGVDEYALTHASGLTDAANKLTGLVGATLGTIVQSVATLLAGYIIALVYNPRMAGVCIACTPLLLSAGACRLLVVVLKDGAIKRAHLRSAIQSGLLFAVAGPDGDVVRLVHSLQLQNTVLQSYRTALSSSEGGTRLGGMSPAAVVYHIVGWGNGVYALSQSLAFLVLSMGFWYGSRLLEHDHIDVQSFFTVLTAVIFGSIQAGNVFNFAPDIEVARRAGAQIFRLLDRSNQIETKLDHSSKHTMAEGHSGFDSSWYEGHPDAGQLLEASIGLDHTQEPVQDVKRAEEPASGSVDQGPRGASVTLRNVSFHHPAVPMAPALLRHITLDIKAGSYVAIISAGAGGSAPHHSQAYLPLLKHQAVANAAHALMSLIERFYVPDRPSIRNEDRSAFMDRFGRSSRPQDFRNRHDTNRDGQILLDDVDISAVPPSKLRKCMSILAPDTRWQTSWGAPGLGGTLFEGTIGWNIRLGKAALTWSPDCAIDAVDLNVSESEVRDAAREAGCLEWIEALPDGLETWISPNPAEATADELAISRAVSMSSLASSAPDPSASNAAFSNPGAPNTQNEPGGSISETLGQDPRNNYSQAQSGAENQINSTHGRVLVLPPYQRQQVALARALVRRPRLLLLDEPTLGLEPEHQAILQEIIDSVALTPAVPPAVPSPAANSISPSSGQGLAANPEGPADSSTSANATNMETHKKPHDGNHNGNEDGTDTISTNSSTTSSSCSSADGSDSHTEDSHCHTEGDGSASAAEAGATYCPLCFPCHPDLRARTTIAVAHVNASASGSRSGPSVAAVAAHADEVVVLHDGRIVQRGTPAQLESDLDGLYATIVRLQELQMQRPSAGLAMGER